MAYITLRDITANNWRATLALTVHPAQQPFVAECVPIAAIVLAKAFVQPGGMTWLPYAIYADDELIGLIELACDPASADKYWIYHFFIDQRYQGQGHGKRALNAFIAMLKTRYPNCRSLWLTVHPDNAAAQHVYTGVGFAPTGEQRDGEPVYCYRLSGAAHNDVERS